MTIHGCCGEYEWSSDTVAMNPDAAAANGMGGEDGYYVMLLHELLHATGHPSRLNRASLWDLSAEGYVLEECTTEAALRIVLEELGFPAEALDYVVPNHPTVEFTSHDGHVHVFDPAPVDHDAAQDMADWALGV